jgi:ATP-dependent RNA helicase MRH4
VAKKLLRDHEPIDVHFPDPSRTRLVKDLKPRSKNGGRLEVAAPTFSRGPLPHVGRPERQEASASPTIFKPTPERLARRQFRQLKRKERKGGIRGGTQSPPTGRDYSRYPKRASGPTRELAPSVAAARAVSPLVEEFDLFTSKSRSSESLPTSFSSPPLLDGLRESVYQVLGPSASPTPIQALSLKHLFSDTAEWREYLLASETGSGKSIAYLLPMLHRLKKTELASEPTPSTTPFEPSEPQRAVNPRALVLAPTHELSRQLSSFAKTLLHNIKLRVLCASRANLKSTPRAAFTASKMAAQFSDDANGTLGIPHLGGSHPVDVLVGTPNKLLEMARGRKWDHHTRSETDKQLAAELSRPSNETSSRGPEPEMGLQNIEWIVVDEADILFGNPFIPIQMTDETDNAYSRPRLSGEHPDSLGSCRCCPWPTCSTYAASSAPFDGNLSPI